MSCAHLKIIVYVVSVRKTSTGFPSVLRILAKPVNSIPYLLPWLGCGTGLCLTNGRAGVSSCLSELALLLLCILLSIGQSERSLQNRLKSQNPSLTLAYAAPSLQTPPTPIPSLKLYSWLTFLQQNGLFLMFLKHLGLILALILLYQLFPLARSILPPNLLADSPGSLSSSERGLLGICHGL